MTDLFKKHKKSGWEPFDTYKVKVRFRNIVGGIPANPELVQTWVDAKNKDKKQAEREKIAQAHRDKTEELSEELAERNGIGFLRDEDGELVIEGRQIKAMLKESANIIKDTCPTGSKKDGKPVFGVKQLKSKVADQIFVVEEYIKLGRTEPDEIVERPIHVMTPMGPRDSIKVCEVCYGVEVEFTVKRHKGTGKMAVPEATLLGILDYAQNIGGGSERSQGKGTFEVLSVEKV